MNCITKEMIRKVVKEVYGHDDDSVTSNVWSQIQMGERCQDKKYGSYINLGGCWTSVGYVEVTNDLQKKLAAKIKQLYKDNGFTVIDSNYSQYNETNRIGLGNGASFWYKK